METAYDEGRSDKADQREAGDEKRTGEVLQTRLNFSQCKIKRERSSTN